MSSGKTMQANDAAQQAWPDSAQLWQWSLALYPAVKTIALNWQDQFGVNVNLLLLLLYLQRRQQQLSGADIQQLQSAVAQQQQLFTEPLRQLRRQLPAHLPEQAASDFKQQLLQVELHSEQLEQRQLIECLQGLPIRPVKASRSLLTIYLELLNIGLTPLQPQIVDLDQAAANVEI